MDVDDVEVIDLRALAGADTVVIGDLTGTDVTLPVYIWGQLRFAAKLPSVLALGTLLLIASFLLLTAAEIFRRRAENRIKNSGAALA